MVTLMSLYLMLETINSPKPYTFTGNVSTETFSDMLGEISIYETVVHKEAVLNYDNNFISFK